MGNGAFSEILALLKKTFAAHLAPVKNICLNKNFRAYFRKGKYIAENRAFFAGFLSDFKM